MQRRLDMEWKPIEIYDAMKKKPKYCVFFVEATKPNRYSNHFLREVITTERYYGNRETTMFCELPEPPKAA